jgi:pyruvate carboxylase
MKRALREFDIAGVATNIPFHLHVLDLPEFQRGRCDVNFVDRELKASLSNLGRIDSSDERVDVAAALLALEEETARGAPPPRTSSGPRGSAWRIAGRTALQDRR